MRQNFFRSIVALLMVGAMLFACSTGVDPEGTGDGNGGNNGGNSVDYNKDSSLFGLTVTAIGESQVELSWNALDGALGYELTYSVSPTGEFMRDWGQSSVTATKGVITMLLPSKQYYFRVREVTSFPTNGKEEVVYGRISGAIRAVTKGGSLEAPVVTSSTTEFITTLEWNTVEGATSYFIYRNDLYNGEYKWANVQTNRFVDDRHLESGESYGYRVVAYNDNDKRTSGLSLVHEAKMKPASLTLPEITYDITSYDVGWSVQEHPYGSLYWYTLKKTDLDRYEIWGWASSIGPVVDGRSIIPGKTYYHKFRQLGGPNGGEASNFGPLLTITVPAPELTAVVQNLKLDSAAHNPQTNFFDVNISWDAVAGAEEYYIYKYDSWGDSYEYLGSTTFNSFTYNSYSSFEGELLVRVIKPSTRESGPFSAPLMVKVK